MKSGRKVRALSVRQPWAALIASGEKHIEYRSWSTSYRGPLIIVASKTFDQEVSEYQDLPRVTWTACTIAKVDLVYIFDDGDRFHWILENPIPLDPVPIRGHLGLFLIDRCLVSISSSP